METNIEGDSVADLDLDILLDVIHTADVKEIKAEAKHKEAAIATLVIFYHHQRTK